MFNSLDRNTSLYRSDVFPRLYIPEDPGFKLDITYLCTAMLLTLAFPLSASSVILPVVMPVFTLKYRFVIV
jgi:hypothetical protein